ncbi:hypothetical protein SEPCBS119000_000886 [Sporothrix epigloea]|uniref:C6 zinc finger domain containing protein n=1 Tax=Sporothrix epigloea TaxID=1892477 RepID=A0ABP0DA75_9PEZI
MPPTAIKQAPSQPAGGHQNARATIVPVIPLPFVRRQQQQRQQRQQQLELDKKQREEKEQKEREQKEKEEQMLKQKEREQVTEEAIVKEANNTSTGDAVNENAEVPAPAEASGGSLHQAHPSSSSLSFGTLHDSNNASPGPTGHGSLPPAPDSMVGPQYNPYNMPNMVGPNEWHQAPPGVLHGDLNTNGFVPPSNGFSSSTPGSYHGSHSPDITVDGPAFQHLGGPYPVPGGPNGHLSFRNNDSMSMVSPPFFHPNGFLDAGLHGGRSGRNGIAAPGIDFRFVHHLQHHMQHSYDNPQTVDCHLILHLPFAKTTSDSGSKTSGQPSEPTTLFAGHRSVLVQSYSIGDILRHDTGVMYNGPFNQPITTLHMRIEDPYISIEAANQALRSLYGHPLTDPSGAGDSTSDQALDKALAILAAGFIFMLDHVESVAVEQAERLLGWDVVEKLLAFCLNGATFPNTTGPDKDTHKAVFASSRLRYARGAGAAVRRLLSRAIAFLVHNVPEDFVFDSSASSYDSTPSLSTLLRFPIDTLAASAGLANSDRHSKANGTAEISSTGLVSLPVRKPSGSIDTKQAGVRSPKIVFGDFAPRMDESAAPMQLINGFGKKSFVDTPTGVYGTDTSAVFSRILLNLPFAVLKHILYQPQLASLRTSNCQAIVQERERRRIQALNAVHAGVILEDLEHRNLVLRRTQQPTPPTQSSLPFSLEEWDVLGWKEVCDGEVGFLDRIWAGAETAR